MTTEPTAELLPYVSAESDLARLHELVVGDAVIARTFDVDPASAQAIGVVVPGGWSARVLDPADVEHLLDHPRRSSTITFEAATSVKAPGGVEVPSSLTVEVRPYRYLEFVPRIRVRVRARVHQDALQLRAELVHPDAIAAAALEALADALTADGTPTGWIGYPR